MFYRCNNHNSFTQPKEIKINCFSEAKLDFWYLCHKNSQYFSPPVFNAWQYTIFLRSLGILQKRVKHFKNISLAYVYFKEISRKKDIYSRVILIRIRLRIPIFKHILHLFFAFSYSIITRQGNDHDAEFCTFKIVIKIVRANKFIIHWF